MSNSLFTASIPKLLKSIIGQLLISMLVAPTVLLGQTFAQGGNPGTPAESTFDGRCEAIETAKSGGGANTENYKFYPLCANSPNECDSENGKAPINCLFLDEPIGGRTGYDLYKKSCTEKQQLKSDGTPSNFFEWECNYTLWYGEPIITAAKESGPFQAVLVHEKGKGHQGPFALLYNYLQLVYNYMSGVIVAMVIFICIAGGVMIITAGSNEESATNGRKMIINALIGMTIWFLASVILYTINPTFFRF